MRYKTERRFDHEKIFAALLIIIAQGFRLRLDVHAGIAQTWDYSVYIGTMDENGMIGSLAWVEVIS